MTEAAATEYVLIGGPVQQLAHHILAKLWLVSLVLSSLEAPRLFTGRGEEKRMQLFFFDGILLLASAACASLNPLLSFHNDELSLLVSARLFTPASPKQKKTHLCVAVHVSPCLLLVQAMIVFLQ